MPSARDKAGRRVEQAVPTVHRRRPAGQARQVGRLAQVKFSVSAFVCNAGSNLCRIKSFVWNVPVTFGADGKKEIALAAK